MSSQQVAPEAATPPMEPTAPPIPPPPVPPTEPTPEPPNPRKFSRTIQAKDAQGKPIGQPQVFYAATEQELLDKVAEAQEHATVKIREQQELLKRTMSESPALPEGAERFDEMFPDPDKLPVRDLTPEQRAALAARLTDPAQMQEAFDELYEARTGLKPAAGAKLQAQQARDAARQRILTEAAQFQAAHTDYFPPGECDANSKAMIEFMQSRGMALTLKNFEIAFRELSSRGLLELMVQQPDFIPAAQPRIEVPAPTAPVIPAPSEVAPPPAAPAPPAPPARESVIPTAIRRSDASGGGAPARKKGPTPQEFAMMSAAELKSYYESTGEWEKAKQQLKSR